MYSHVNTNGWIVDCEWYSVFHILLDFCKAVKQEQGQKFEDLSTCNQKKMQKKNYTPKVKVYEILLVWRANDRFSIYPHPTNSVGEGLNGTEGEHSFHE